MPTPEELSQKEAEEAWQNLSRRLRLQLLFHKAKGTAGKTQFTGPSAFEPPRIYDLLENILETHKKIYDEVMAQPMVRQEPNNLSRPQTVALKRLGTNRNIEIKIADKGSQVVIQDAANYKTEALRQLHTRAHYKPITNTVSNENRERIHDIFENLLYRVRISKRQFQYLAPQDDIRLRRFYLIPKSHKPLEKWTQNGQIPPGRPIVSDCNSESCPSAEYIDSFLAPLAAMHESHIKDTTDFLSKILSLDIPQNAYLATLDVEALYTNIDNREGMRSVGKAFRENRNSNRPNTALLNLLGINLEGNDFVFDNNMYLQASGTSMGKKFAPNYANIFMADFEHAAIAKCKLKPAIYLRFLDDIFIVWNHSKEAFGEFVEILNRHHFSINLTSVIDERQVNFLDTTIYKGKNFGNTHRLSSKVFFKPTDTLELLHATSHHPPHTFDGIVKSQILRYHRICSDKKQAERACNKLFRVLRDRGYAQTKLRSIKKQVLAPKVTTGREGSRHCSSKMCQFCKRDWMQQRTEVTGPEGPVDLITSQDCNTANGVYLIYCKSCDARYVGQTKNSFRSRLHGHISDIRSRDAPDSDTHKITPVSTHFTGECTINDLAIVLLEHFKPIHTDDPNANQAKLLMRERHWQITLKTFSPFGLNQVHKPDKTADVLPFTIRYTKKGKQLAKIAKRVYNSVVTAYPNKISTQIITAFKKSKSLKDTLVTALFRKGEGTGPNPKSQKCKA